MPELLRAKLYPPRLSHDLIPRPPLVQRLNAALTAPLTLVSAPAGFGKSTLLVEWLSQTSFPTGWLALDENDNDLLTFVTHFVASIESVFPNACRATLALLHAPRLPSAAYLARQLGNDIAELPGEFVQIFDDYHLLRDARVLELMDGLLQHMPPPLHLVLATRIDPALPLARLRARGQLVELRAAQLRFSPDEADAFLRRSIPTPLPDDVRALIQQRTEGWPAGLRLTSISLRSQSDLARYKQTFRQHGEEFVTDYLVDEVFVRQTPEIQSFLLQTSILDEFTPELCDAVIAAPAAGTSARFIGQLKQANLFVISLDESNSWARYHHLFRDLLAQKRERECGDNAALHARASAWFTAQGYVQPAVQHALSAGLADRAAKIVEDNVHAALNREEQGTLESWLALLPPELVARRPALLIARIYALDLRIYPASVEALLRMSAELAANELQGDIENLRARALYWRGEFRASIAAAERAIALLPSDHIYARGAAKMYIGLAHHAVGETATAVRLLSEAAEEDPTQPPEIMLRALVALASAHLAASDLVRLQQTAQALQRTANAGDFLGSQAWAHRMLGVLHYEWNDLYLATQHFALASEMRYAINTRAAHEALVGLARSYQARGMTAEANRTAALLVEFDAEIQYAEALQEAYSLQAHLALLQGDVDKAWQLMPRLGEPPVTPFLWTEQPALTTIQILIAHGTPQDIALAVDAATRLQGRAQELSDTRSMLQLLALQALALEAAGENRAALTALKRSVTLAERGGFIRSYVDLGPRMAELLRQVEHAAPEYVKRILKAFPAQTASRAAPRSPSLKGETPVEPLTGREIQVLELLARRFSAQEIAAELVISKTTTKTHIQHIYGKLGVNSRRAAVETARTLGILSSD